MKKLLLSVISGIFATCSFGQFTIGATSLTFTGSTPPASNSFGQFYAYQPYGLKDDPACLNDAVFDGGFDPNQYNATEVDPARPEGGIVFYGGGIRMVYTSSPAGCVAAIPSFGFHTGKGAGDGGFAAGSGIDLSAPANQVIKFTYRNGIGTSPFTTGNMNVKLQIFDGIYNPLLTGVPVTFVGDNVAHTVTIDFSSYIAPGADLTAVKQISFLYDNVTQSDDFGVSLLNIQLGSSVTGLTLAVNDPSKLAYPNPNNTGNINLKSIVKSYVLTNLNGTIVSEGLDTDKIDVSSVEKGIYFLKTDNMYMQKIVLY